MTHPLERTNGVIMPDALYHPDEVATILAFKPATLQQYRREGRGPVVTMVGVMPRYRGKHILEWMEARTLKAA